MFDNDIIFSEVILHLFQRYPVCCKEMLQHIELTGGFPRSGAPSWWSRQCSSWMSLDVYMVLCAKICVSLWWQRHFQDQDHISLCPNRNILLLCLFIFNFIIDSTSLNKMMLKTTLAGDRASRSSSISAVLSHLSCIHHECLWMFTWYCVPKYAFRCKA